MLKELDIIERLRPIELSQMDSIMLMNRVDTKYLTEVGTLKKILEMVADCGYLVFEISGKRIHQYRSLYYDTPSQQMYLDHHNRRLDRQKLRTRCYELSGQTFLELKTKNNNGRTKKKRFEIAPQKYWMGDINDVQMAQWLDEKMRYERIGMTPSLETLFDRITLVNPEKTERSTIDIDLRFNNVRRGTTANMGDLVIIEVKQDGNISSKLRDILLELRVKPIRISKYCIGTAMTDDKIKSCRFKQKVLLINKMKNRI